MLILLRKFTVESFMTITTENFALARRIQLKKRFLKIAKRTNSPETKKNTIIWFISNLKLKYQSNHRQENSLQVWIKISTIQKQMRLKDKCFECSSEVLIVPFSKQGHRWRIFSTLRLMFLRNYYLTPSLVSHWKTFRLWQTRNSKRRQFRCCNLNHNNQRITELFLNLITISIFNLKFTSHCRTGSIHQIPQQQFHFLRGRYKSGNFCETRINIQIVQTVENLLLLLISFSILEHILLRNHWIDSIY